MTFGQRVTALREKRNMNRSELARRLEMPVNTLRHYECDEREPGSETIVKIAKIFDCTTDYLIGNEAEPIRPVQWELIRATMDLPDDRIRALIDFVKSE